MSEPQSLAGHLLIAMPSLMDPNFFRSVILVGAHSVEEGAFGVIVNRPLPMGLDDVISDLETTEIVVPERPLPPVLSGGPVQPSHGFVIFEDGPLASSDIVVGDDSICLSGSSETLRDLVDGKIATRFYLLLGYAGWAPGQLETEIEENSWLVVPSSADVVFDAPFENRWEAALRAIGVDPGLLVAPAGPGGEPS